jgi:hypothetical protein
MMDSDGVRGAANMTRRQPEYSVTIEGTYAVEYREPERVVVFVANMRDHEVHLGYETVSGKPMTAEDRERIITRVYEYLNHTRRMQVDFLHRDGSYWGRRQGWVCEPLTEKELARFRAQADRRRRILQFFRSLRGR